MFKRQTYKDQRVVIDGKEVAGVQSVNGEFTLQNDSLALLGGGGKNVFAGDLSAQLSLTKLIVGKETLYSLIKSGAFSGSFIYDGGSFGFEKGYLTSYECSGALNEVPSVSVDILAFGQVGKVNPPAMADPIPPISIAHPGDIVLQINGAETTNRVRSFNYSVSIERNPVFIMGQTSPASVFVELPVEITSRFELAVSDYESPLMNSLLCDEPTRDISITLNDCYGSIIQTYSSPTAKLNSVGMGSSMGDELTVSLTYQSTVYNLNFFT